MNTMGNRIKALRVDANLTQEELAQMLGMQKAAVNKYELGRVENIKRSTIERLAKIFHVSPAYILAIDDPIPNGYERLDAEDRRQVDGLIEYLLSREKYKKTDTGIIA